MAPSKKKKAGSNRNSTGTRNSNSTRSSNSKSKSKSVKPKLKTAHRTATVAGAGAGADTDADAASAFKPIEDRVLVAVEAESETTSGGIIIPGNVESRPNRGTVLAKGPGRRGKKGGLRPLDVNVGDRVLFPEYAGTKIEIGGDDFLILREDELLGVVTL